MEEEFKYICLDKGVGARQIPTPRNYCVIFTSRHDLGDTPYCPNCGSDKLTKPYVEGEEKDL